MATDWTRRPGREGAIAQSVLVVDDDAETVRQLREVLSEHGYAVRTAKDGGQAHSGFAMNRPDFVILDVILPGESGFELCERLKQKDETVSILMLSVIDMDDARDLARRAGADGYVTKPYSSDELLAQMAQITAETWEKTHVDTIGEHERIRFKCPCGKRFKVSPVHRGRTMTCPDCGEPLVVPRHA